MKLINWSIGTVLMFSLWLMWMGRRFQARQSQYSDAYGDSQRLKVNVLIAVFGGCAITFGMMDYHRMHSIWSLQRWSIVMLIVASVYTLATVVMSLKHR